MRRKQKFSLLPCYGVSKTTGAKVGSRHRWPGSGWKSGGKWGAGRCIFCGRTVAELERAGRALADWPSLVRQEMARLEEQLGPMRGADDPMDWHRRRAAQAKEMAAFVETLGGRLWQKPGGLWALRIDGRTSSSTSGWTGAVNNALAAAEKAA